MATKLDGAELKCGQARFIKGERVVIMGIVNVTPDSFSDGGQFAEPQAAIDHALKLIDQGADVVDIGGVSTAPNAAFVDVHEEARRIFGVIDGLIKMGKSNICVDTSSPHIAAEALKRGAAWINDQSAGANEAMCQAVLSAQAVVLMHSRGQPGVQAGEWVSYGDLFGDINGFFAERMHRFVQRGFAKERIIVDPGLGFGKGLTDSLTLTANMNKFAGAASWSLIGASRKSFIGKLTGIMSPAERDFATLGAHMAAVCSGADIIRTHNVLATSQMLQVFDACKQFAVKHRSFEHENLH
jgi:dihydropteroate synthase